MTSRGKRITSVGKIVEEWEVERYKEMGIWRGNNVKFFDEENNISGEVDAFVYDGDINKTIGVEIKTGYDYQFRKEVIGNPGRKGSPKPEHLMQTMLYLNYFKDIPCFKMVYIDRGNAARAEYSVTLDKSSGGAIVDGKRIMKDITIPGILHRYKKLNEHLSDGTIPPRDYQLQYSPEKMKLLYDSGKLSKKDSEMYSKNKDIQKGDWNCSYCSYKDYCHKETKNA
jgi:CRISPR/Cas system-associated exonuclease Cas4 (RecB family)